MATTSTLPRISVQMPVDLHALVEELAKRLGRSKSQIMVDALAEVAPMYRALLEVTPPGQPVTVEWARRAMQAVASAAVGDASVGPSVSHELSGWLDASERLAEAAVRDATGDASAA
jgi:predicted transcriptional regulator